MSDLPTQPTSHTPPEATLSIHGDFLEKAVPQWLVDATPERRSALKNTVPVAPLAYKTGAPEQRQAVSASFKASTIAQVRLDATMATFKDVDAFARPLLLKALKDQYQVEVDVDKTLLCLRRPLYISAVEVEIGSFEFLKLSMLQAALHNFEAWECKSGAYHSTSGFVLETTTAGTYESTAVNLTVSQFMTLCRSLDIGAQYQTYLNAFFAPVDTRPEPPLRQHFIAAQKAAMKAAADYAVMTGDIEPADHAMIVSVVNGSLYPTLGNKRVWLMDLSLMKKRLTGCVYFAIGDRYSDELILYVPHDPAHPLKRYTKQQLRDAFKRLFTARDGMAADDPAPTAYQRFFSQFVPYDQRPYYFSQFTQKSADSPSGPLSSPWRTVIEYVFGASGVTRIKELPPEKPAKMEPDSDPYLAPGNLMPYRSTGTFSGLLDLFPFLYEKHRDQVLADARAHAVPTADVDAKAREAKLAHLLEVGMLALNLVSMFVPVLGEVMLAVMAEQLLTETLEGAIEWAEGDKHAAKAHLIDVAQNLAQIAVMAGVGMAVSKFRSVKAEPVLEKLSPVTLPNGETRLWKPDLAGYESSTVLDAHAVANAQGQYTLNGKTYMRMDGQVYEQVFDASIKQWRIKHPTRAEVYQPLLQSNGRGAWRHTLERPAEWDRLTLLRRIGHETEAFSDTQLLKVADVSGVSDNALRKMHTDLAAPPPELLDAMRLFTADTDSAQVIEQLRGSRPIDDRYLFALPLVTEMPRWPKTRALEVFDGADFTGKPMKYGSGYVPRGGVAKASIQVSRADVLGGRLPTAILAALDETEVTRLLGAEGARVLDARPQEFGKQLADYALTREPAIFDSLYTGTEPVDKQVRLLQRTCPGLSEAAARETLAHASAADLKRLEATRRVPLNLLEEARWYALQGRQTRAYAGLRSETMASADSRRLALHTLEKLPGWPDTLRLEVRDGSDSGLLLDSVGSATARDKRYLVKKGPRFQAFNERGEALNSLPTEGDNFYASLLHAMPDDARQALGVPQVSQRAQLQAKIIAYADAHRGQTQALLEPQRKWFKPPVRVNDTLVGYYASGRGQSASLESHAQALYGLSDTQAADYIRQLQLQGKNDRAIFNHLQNRQRDYTTLERELDEWVGPHSGTAADVRTYQYRSRLAQQLKNAWRMEPLAGKVNSADCLYISADEHLPPLTVDFSHVRELTVTGTQMNDVAVDTFLARFPNVQTLSIGDAAPLPGAIIEGASALTTLPVAVTRLSSLKSLRFGTSAGQLEADFFSRLNTLTSLEALRIEYRGYSGTALNSLDVGTLTQLKRLEINALALTQWPANVENLAHLERLDLSHTLINEIPATLYSGHEQLWAGLSMDWSRFSPEAFKPAYEYVRTYKGKLGHLVELHQMVNSYAKGELELLAVNSGLAKALREKIITTVQSPEARFAVIEDLRARYTDVFAGFYDAPVSTVLRFRPRKTAWRTGSNASVLNALEANWWGAVGESYGLTGQASVFELPTQDIQLPTLPSQVYTLELPPLPAASFAHVRTLRMRWPGASTEQMQGFIRAFSGTQTLELSGLGLTEIPIGAGDLPALTQLDLSSNGLGMPALQAQLNDLGSLERLDLSHNSNPLTGVDVSALTQLKALNLRGAKVQAWPTGAEHLTQLAWLDLRDNQLVSLPPQVLNNDAILLKTNLAGNHFSAAGEAALASSRQRIEDALGLPRGALAAFERQSVPGVFPPQQTGLTMTDFLLPLPREVEVSAGAAGFVGRLQQLTPRVTDEKALQWFGQLRQRGMSDPQIDTLLTTWHQEYQALTRQLNGWLYTRELTGPDISWVADERQLVALHIVECWQTGVSAEAGYEMSLHGLQAADLPTLTVQFSNVHTLNLTGVKCSVAGAEGFLDSFPALRKLNLSGNELTVVPEAVGRMAELEELVLDSNDISEPESLYRLLKGEHLRRLNLCRNHLSEFSTEDFGRLETLDLSYNRLTEWPDGVLEAAHLRTLNLCGNDLTEFPEELLDGSHHQLVLGTDISENESLSLESFERLRAYGDGAVMGWSRSQIDMWIQGFEDDAHGSGDEEDGYESLESIPEPQEDEGEAVLSSWLAHSPEALKVSRRQAWQQLAQEPGHERFFHLLERLRDTKEYELSVADLTRRVWGVIEAAAASAQMREPLFVAAETHGTCIDGRTLTFSAMEVLVFEANVLRDIPVGNLKLKGRRLLDLSRQLFRLDEVDTLAERNAAGLDRAEVRLEYRIGLTRGWPDGLELPGQPTHMAFGRPLSGQVLTAARAQVLEAQASERFYESLVARDYWLNYLQERYPDEFQALESDAAQRHEALEDEYADRVPGSDSEQRYNAALTQLEVDRGSARAQLLLRLSRQQVSEYATGAEAVPSGGPQPGPSTRQQ
ncbi:NEL-type E3 ubiquitin ligase domain-containing protein [Pseudomonas sp. L1(2025)]|uniref:NEL-type E3 ubiquitin ligase domain-containing protein n=1 Tax=Pseudomonas sp. L1(2025) TaxID=3449429 RepID=UPI003F68F71E